MSEMPLLDVVNGHGPVELDSSNGEDAAGDGAALSIGGVTYERGLGVHAASEVSVALAGQCSVFTAVVGVDGSVGSNGSVVFSVLGDGEVLETTDVLVGGQAGVALEVDITGVDRLTLAVGDAGDNEWWDHANWAEARVECGDDPSDPDPDPTDPDPDPTDPDPTDPDPTDPAWHMATLDPVDTGANTHSVTTADLDGDGLADLVAAVPGLDGISVARGNGNGTFQTPNLLPTGPGTFPKYAAVADVDGDGALDIVSANQDSTDGDDVSVFLGVGDGTFAAGVTYEACVRPHEVEIVDLDGDGILDVAVACWGGDDLAVLTGDGTGAFGDAALYPAGNAGHSLVSSDFNGDGAVDLAVAAYGSNRVMVVMNDGDGGFEAPVEYWSGLGPHNIQLTDLDGDGVPDLLVTAELDDAVGVLYGRPDGTFAETHFLDVGSRPKAATVVDLDGDGILDIVTANTHGNYPSGSAETSVSVLLGTGEGYQPPMSIPVALTPFAVHALDLDGDGHVELLTANWHSGDVAVLRHTAE